jgi:hypothetical protein
MKNDLFIIKISYVVGIIADGLWTIALFFPKVFSIITNNPNFAPEIEARLIMGIAGSLMLGWTLLLIWAFLKPIERRFILLLTAFPVVFCLFVIALISALNYNQFTTWILIKTLVIIILMTYSYFKANRIAKYNY